MSVLSLQANDKNSKSAPFASNCLLIYEKMSSILRTTAFRDGISKLLLRTNVLHHFHHVVFNKFPIGKRFAVLCNQCCYLVFINQSQSSNCTQFLESAWGRRLLILWHERWGRWNFGCEPYLASGQDFWQACFKRTKWVASVTNQTMQKKKKKNVTYTLKNTVITKNHAILTVAQHSMHL